MTINFQFPTFQQMFPEEKRKSKLLREWFRYYWRTFICTKQCRELTEFLNNHKHWTPMFNSYLYRVNTILNQYCDKAFSKEERLSAVLGNFATFDQLLPNFAEKLMAEKSVLLVQLTEELGLYLNINYIDPYEGFFSLNIKNSQGESQYDASFTFLQGNKILIASIQGPKGEGAAEKVKVATKQLHGLRPMFMLIYGFKLLAKVLGCELLGIPHKRQSKYRFNDSSKLLFNYDEFWAENAGVLQEKYWQLPLEIERKPLEEIASKKRSMYRKRYEMLDKAEADIQQFQTQLAK